MNKFDEAFAAQNYAITAFEGMGGHMVSLKDVWRAAWDAAITAARTEVIGVGEDATEAAKAKDATDYVAGYQDCSVDCDESLRRMLSNVEVQGQDEAQLRTVPLERPVGREG